MGYLIQDLLLILTMNTNITPDIDISYIDYKTYTDYYMVPQVLIYYIHCLQTWHRNS